MSGEQLNARIVYWGPAGAGKSANLHWIHQRMRSDQRGDLREMPTGSDPSVHYEILPIDLGRVGSTETRLQIVAVPSGDGQSETRRELLEGVSGLVLVLDARSDAMEANLASVSELRAALAAEGKEPTDVPCVIQYNKRDQSDPYAMEELHRQIGLDVPVFEGVANQGTGVLQALTTVSKLVVRTAQEENREAQEPQLTGEFKIREVESALDVLGEEKADASLTVVDASAPRIVDGRNLSLELTLEDGNGARHRLAVSIGLESDDPNAG